MVTLLCCVTGFAPATHDLRTVPSKRVQFHFLFPLQDQDKEYVGFATLPNQVHRKSVKKGFDFTLMVAGTKPLLIGTSEAFWDSSHTFPYRCSCSEGESGLGKSTLVNSLFLTDLYKDRKLLNAEGEAAAAFGPASVCFSRPYPKTNFAVCPVCRANHTNGRNHQTHGGYRRERRQTQAHHRGHSRIRRRCEQH